MAERGKPLPWKLREEIKHLRYFCGLTVRQIATALGVNKETVCRYAPKIDETSSGQDSCSDASP